MKTRAEIVCDSISPDGVRLTTFVVVFHRFVLAEFNTHRVFSRNSASSRAIPSKVMLENVRGNPALPISWGTNKPGMQAGAELEGDSRAEAIHCYSEVRHHLRNAVYHLVERLGVHKQTANRLLEPFNWHTVIITAVDFDNFFWQRCDADAQPEMKAAADAMQLAFYTHEPTPLTIGEWHLPFINETERLEHSLEELKQVSVARCARVSGLQHDGVRDWAKDIDLYTKLKTKVHPSPFEHVATPCTHVAQIALANQAIAAIITPATIDADDVKAICTRTGNFGRGWHQYRKYFEGENRLNFRPNLPALMK